MGADPDRRRPGGSAEQRATFGALEAVGQAAQTIEYGNGQYSWTFMNSYITQLAGTVKAVAAACAAPAPAAGQATGRPGFASALSVWKQTPAVAAADASRYLLRAADDLRAAGGSGDTSAISELTNLAALPDMGTTAAQQQESQSDISALDSFFGTPGLNPNS